MTPLFSVSSISNATQRTAIEENAREKGKNERKKENEMTRRVILPSIRQLLSWISPFSRGAVTVPDR